MTAEAEVRLPQDPQFERLRVGGVSWNGRTSYWLGPDHLVVVNIGAYEETYQRIQYADIGGIIMRRTLAWLWMAGIEGIVLLLLGWGWMEMFLAAQSENPTSPEWVVPLVLMGTILVGLFAAVVVELGAGPSCDCLVVTAVQVRQLPRVVRWRQAERLVAALEPRVRAAQQGLGSGPVREPSADPASTAGAAPAEVGATGTGTAALNEAGPGA